MLTVLQYQCFFLFHISEVAGAWQPSLLELGPPPPPPPPSLGPRGGLLLDKGVVVACQTQVHAKHAVQSMGAARQLQSHTLFMGVEGPGGGGRFPTIRLLFWRLAF